ncbi:DUF5110 domain-containing protein, partial [Lactobacillus acetotolerans]
DVITFRLFGDHGNYIHYQDDGEDFAYQNGQFNLYKITISQKNTVELTNFGYNCPYKKVVLLSENGRQEFIFDQKNKTYKLV